MMKNSPAQLLQLEAVSKCYEGVAADGALPVLRDITFAVPQSEAVAIIGPSGSGKSTLLNIIGTLDRPTSGQVRLAGRELTSLSDNELADVRSREIGFVFQSHHLLPQCTAMENVLIPTLALGAEQRDGAPQRASALLARVGLADRANHRPGQLSGGERQRVAIVRGLINQPKLLLADEPTGALDSASADELARLLLELNREQGVTLIVVTHNLELASRMGRVMELRDGCLAPSRGTGV
jgi:ABC-type lipoprotein export system ATPase subunit